MSFYLIVRTTMIHFTVIMIFFLIFVSVTMVIMGMFIIFHSFHDLLFQYIYIVHHRKDFHVLRIQGSYYFFHPLFHLSTVANHQICLLHGDHICRCGLK